ncbi:Ubiquitin carboxyl-terminal hydrolase 2 [Neolecta irregularis DAH-3]|uniref:Ubiquitin carboxyl-terminal hydrolase 2 n=1 Tax=Neolecta irregularis (strain DAH-3) TaxID=1198029 RepID=A0A1U7LPN0_NEOID|nr:Ubiquitin carboxyl-terminal hydrolase 2 [Neolecta irregularis DAH-3]|eukprot:OLL24630.1 Ubiquitin carboxyl-terminal hydrolase 2 [Neolecta irregularis DAH-3]
MSTNIPRNITAVFSSLIRSLWTPEKLSKVISPHQFFDQIARTAPIFQGYQQQDAQEFLHCVLNRLHTEMSTTQHSTIITNLFQGELWNEITCKKCGNVSVKSDPFLDLSLDIPEHLNPAIHGCLENYTAPCEAEWFCQRCGVSTNCEKTLKLGICPAILCLHLKRFRWNPGRRRKQKLDGFVEFPLSRLDVSDWMCIDYDTDNCGLYDCYAIVVHHGQGINSGHYTAFVLGVENQWYHVNDEKVIPVTLELVENVKAYIIFYKRRE